MWSNPTGLSYDAQKNDKKNKKKPIKHSEPKKLPDQSNRLQTVLEICSKNSSNHSCANTAIVSNIALISKVEFGKLCISKRLQAYIIK